MKITHIAVLLVLPLLAASCFKDQDFEPAGTNTASQTQPARLPSEETRQVMIMVSGGFNSLSTPLTRDLTELSENYLPTIRSRAEHILLVLSRHTDSGYSTPVAPVLYRLYKDWDGNVVRDTLLRWNKKDQITDPKVLKETFIFAKEKFPAKGYGVVYSSHGSGWIPAENSTKSPSLQSIGQDEDTNNVREMELQEFVDCLPYKMEYVLFDACFMACVEVAWALKDKADVVGFSPTEIMNDGFDYAHIAERLLDTEPNPLGVCEDYFAQYSAPGVSSPYASVSLVRTDAMQPLADICKTLFEKYREQLATLSIYDVQRYYRLGKNPRFEHLFDLRHMLQKAGATLAERTKLDEALEACVLYEAHTPYFMSLELKNVCGLSSYMPSSGSEELNTFYKTLDWNKATELIK